MNYTLQIVDIRAETESTITLCFKQPGLKKVKYKAGQYLSLIFRINNRRYIRPYSFSSCPGVDGYLEVTIKRVPNGVVSNHIHDQVKIGDSVEVMPPMGDFVYDVEKTFEQVYLWGVGSGITPLIAIAKDILYHFSGVEVYLIYGNRNKEQTIFFNKIKELQEQFKDRFTVKYFHTQYVINHDHLNIVEGRIDSLKASHLLSNIEPDAKLAHFVCGPPGLKESVKDALVSKGFDLMNFYSEDFELVKDPKDFEQIHTQIIEIKTNGVGTNLEVVKGKTILEAALEANLDLPYSCQTGNCSSCKAVLTSGEAKMIGLTKVRDDLQQDEFLLCCTHPLTAGVYFEIRN